MKIESLVWSVGPAAAFGLIALALWFRRRPGPRWPLLLFLPAAAISVFTLWEFNRIGSSFERPLDSALLFAQFMMLVLVVGGAKGCEGSTMAGSMAILALNPVLVVPIWIIIGCAIDSGQCP